MSELKLTLANFDAEVAGSDVPVLVDFWAEWCGPCKMLGPVLSEIAAENVGSLKVGKVNVDEEPELSRRFGISSIPSLFVFKNGQVTSTAVGYMPKEELEKLIK